MSDMTFDDRIRSIAARAHYPRTPHLRARVVAAFDAQTPHVKPAPAAPSRSRWTPFAFGPRAAIAAAVVVIAAAIAAVIAVPSSRSAIADFFGVEGSKIDIVPTTTALPVAPAGIPDTAQRTSIDDLGGAIGFSPLLPQDDRTPDETFVVRYGTQDVAIIRYDEFDLWEARLQAESYFGKEADPRLTVTDTFVGHAPAHWVSGGPHFVGYVDANGNRVESSERIVETNTLIWNNGETFLRMETNLTLEAALRIAESLE
ncbi:MAG TPA: hypothetical protein VFH62_08965 [Dehalococcoidia bacterium]|nr:hypothetical protein [Dehalococcoidia bacterium]